MHWKAVTVLLLALCSGQAGTGGFQADLDRAKFYQVLASGSLKKVNEQLDLVRNSALLEKTALEGALLMKKAGLLAVPLEKLRAFNAGRKKLESAIQKDAKNTEYRFLRLIIQENAPEMLHYRDRLEEDSKSIRLTFPGLPKDLQESIVEYSRKSKVLHPTDF